MIQSCLDSIFKNFIFQAKNTKTAGTQSEARERTMDFKRHHQHQGFNFNSRPNNPSNGSHGGHGGYQSGGFVSHHPHPPHNSRPFKLNDGHNNGGRLNLVFIVIISINLTNHVIGYHNDFLIFAIQVPLIPESNEVAK